MRDTIYTTAKRGNAYGNGDGQRRKKGRESARDIKRDEARMKTCKSVADTMLRGTPLTTLNQYQMTSRSDR